MKARRCLRLALPLSLTLLGCGRSSLSTLDTVSYEPGSGGAGQAGAPAQAGHAGTSTQAGHAGTSAQAGQAGSGSLTSLVCDDGQLAYEGTLAGTPISVSTPAFAQSGGTTGDVWDFLILNSTSFFSFLGHGAEPGSNPVPFDLVFGRAEGIGPTGSWFCGREGKVTSPTFDNGQFSLPALTVLGACPGGDPVTGTMHVRECDNCPWVEGTVDGSSVVSSLMSDASNEDDMYGHRVVMNLVDNGRLFMNIQDKAVDGVLLLPQGSPPVLTLYCLGSGVLNAPSKGVYLDVTFSSLSRLGVCPANPSGGSLDGCF